MYSNKRQLNKNEHLHDSETVIQIKFNQIKVEVEEIGKIVLVFSTKNYFYYSLQGQSNRVYFFIRNC